MGLKITKAGDPIKVGSLITMIYGQPGVGKTSIACSAESPLVLDFDKGIHRSAYRKDAVQVETWTDVTNIEASDIEGYNTIVVDTVGKALDALSDSIINANPKFGRGGQLTMQGFGALKAQFIAWLKKLTRLGVDVILIAHVKEEKNGDNILLRPDMTGGSYQFALQSSDLVGYQYATPNGTLIQFAPTGYSVGKDCANIGNTKVPNLVSEPEFFANILTGAKQHLEGLSEEQQKAMEVIQEWHGKVDDAKDADTVNALVSESQALDEGMIKQQAKVLVARRAKELGLSFKDGAFHGKEAA
ncbi:hypothetical protein R84981_002858 [Carnimonas sp. R-84981]|uniref:ATP-binding protein n=1 Tax=Carnimonas bestiolae TaxID=3402172 RepID=UPI003EDC581C